MKKQNLELKYFCEDFSKIRTTLKQLGAKKESIKNQNLGALVKGSNVDLVLKNNK